MKPFSLDHLSETEFEEFSYDLLTELGFVNVTWRKGTGLKSSTPDRGRDVECQLKISDIDGSIFLEKWFVQCKHYKRGVPATELQGILTWAKAENPDKVLIIASNFLSNPAKDFLKDYKSNNKPSFKIKVWERPDLEKLTLSKSRLLRKYNIVGEHSYLAILHNAHILYMKSIQINSLQYLFDTLDKLDPKKRDEILGFTYHEIIQPRYRKPIPGKKELLKELLIDEVTYDAFKKTCYRIINSNLISTISLISLIVNLTLQYLINIGDKTSVDEFIQKQKRFLEFIEEEGVYNGSRNAMRQSIKERIATTPERTQHNYEIYEYFCENVVSALLLEDIFSKLKPSSPFYYTI